MKRAHRRRAVRSFSGLPTDVFPWLMGAGALALLALRGTISNAVISAMRTPQDILDAVDTENPASTPDLQPGWWPEPPGYKPGVSWCSKLAARVTARLGCPIIWGRWGTLINDQIKWLDAGNDGWYQIATRDQAQQAALAGKVVLATYFNSNPPPNNHGHVAIVLPISGAMMIAQAGARNFNRGYLSAGFGNIQPVFYGHE